MANKPVIQKFWEKVNVNGPLIVESPCWEWTGTRNEYGYGRFRTGLASLVYAHRFAYELEYGPVPKDLKACHRCDNPACCNPNHIFIGTDLENAMDAKRKGRYGNRQGVRLSEEERENVRAAARSGMSQKAISESFGISPKTARRWCQAAS